MNAASNSSSQHPPDFTPENISPEPINPVNQVSDTEPQSLPIADQSIPNGPIQKTVEDLPAAVTLLPNGLDPIKTLQILRSIGYGLLILSLIDLLYVIFPPEFTKPIWEYQTIGDLVRLIPVPMLAFMLVFYGEAFGRKRIERPIVGLLSWSTLIFAVFCLLMIPLTVVNTLRISQYNNDQINTQTTQQKQQLNNTKTQLEKATPEQLQQLVSSADKTTGQAPRNPEAAKNQVLGDIQKAQERADEQSVDARKNVQRNLMKNSSKIILESLVGGCLFLYTWWMTGWARRRQADAYETADAYGVRPGSQNKTSTKSRRRRRN